MNAAADPTHRSSGRRLWHALLALALGVAMAGFLVGTGQESPPPRPLAPDVQAAADSDVPTALSYLEMAERKLGPNADWSSDLADLPQPEMPTEAPVSVDATRRDEVLAVRAQRRAYFGAPPVIPHPIDQRNAAACTICHGEGRQIGSVVAPKLSHEVLPNCTQCHVESFSPSLPPGVIRAANTFTALASPTRGERAWIGAPPTIPHTTQMRTNCNSCHGPLSDPGIRTTHPWRVNCQQCHAPSAELDRRRFLPFVAGPTLEVTVE